MFGGYVSKVRFGDSDDNGVFVRGDSVGIGVVVRGNFNSCLQIREWSGLSFLKLNNVINACCFIQMASKHFYIKHTNQPRNLPRY